MFVLINKCDKTYDSNLLIYGMRDVSSPIIKLSWDELDALDYAFVICHREDDFSFMLQSSINY